MIDIIRMAEGQIVGNYCIAFSDNEDFAPRIMRKKIIG